MCALESGDTDTYALICLARPSVAPAEKSSTHSVGQVGILRLGRPAWIHRLSFCGGGVEDIELPIEGWRL